MGLVPGRRPLTLRDVIAAHKFSRASCSTVRCGQLSCFRSKLYNYISSTLHGACSCEAGASAGQSTDSCGFLTLGREPCHSTAICL